MFELPQTRTTRYSFFSRKRAGWGTRDPEIIEQETFRIVRKAVEELPTQMRNIILYSMKGLKNNEIADKLQISEGTVHKLKKIAYRKLRESLKGINYILCLFLCK